jgi:hypothetical protein
MSIDWTWTSWNDFSCSEQYLSSNRVLMAYVAVCAQTYHLVHVIPGAVLYCGRLSDDP